MIETSSGPTALDEAPVLVHVTRGGFVESAHRATLVARDASGATLLGAGAVDAPVLPRSCLKPVQALAMVRAGLDLPPRLLALVCASHSGERDHLAGVAEILDRAGLTVADLGNTPALPHGELEHARWLAAGRPPEAVAQDCSGKHAGMLLTCATNGWPLEGYLDPDHPLQRAILATVEQECGPVSHTTVDGCGAPLFAIPLSGLAAAFGRLAGATKGERQRVADAMRAAPEMVGGTDRDVTTLMRAVPGLVAKDGAESCYAAGTADGTGIALKVVDGAPFARARTVLLATVLQAVAGGLPGLDELAVQPVLGHGRPVGEVRAVGLGDPARAAG